MVERIDYLKRDLRFIKLNNKILIQKVSRFKIIKIYVGRKDIANEGFYKFKTARL